MESEVDTSILNSVNVKRFTKSVLERYGADIDNSDRAKWTVAFPPELVNRLEREEGTLVFDPADREPGVGDLLVQPGTTVFSALLDLVQQSTSVGRLRLTEDELQVNLPSVLQESSLSVTVSEFTERTTDTALAFHFRVKFETPASFHREEMFTVTVDPETRTRLPALTERLTAHLPQLLEEQNEATQPLGADVDVDAAYEQARQAVVDRSRPIVKELHEDAEETVHERLNEVTDWYDQRRSELDEQLNEQRDEIRKWREKQRKARKDSTRRRYIQNRRDAEQELEQLQEEIERKKKELDEEEREEIDAVIDRNEVTVDASVLGITEVEYVRGRLSLGLESSHATTDATLTYLPATDEFQGLDCAVCGQDLTDGVMPRLCADGHIVGDPCAQRCRDCGLTYCAPCEQSHEFAACTVCWDDICQSCITSCSECGEIACADHRAACDACGEVACRLCGEGCSTCGTYYCDTHLLRCPACEEYHCETHLYACDVCDGVRCESHIGHCQACGTTRCATHRGDCATCGDTLCDQHATGCTLCARDPESEQRYFCAEHTAECIAGGEPVCTRHRSATTLGAGKVCNDHRANCSTCGVAYSETNLSGGRCTACQSLGEVAESEAPADIRDEFRSVKVGTNAAYMVMLGKQLLGRNKLIVYNHRTGEEVSRKAAGMLKQLAGAYK